MGAKGAVCLTCEKVVNTSEGYLCNLECPLGTAGCVHHFQMWAGYTLQPSFL